MLGRLIFGAAFLCFKLWLYKWLRTRAFQRPESELKSLKTDKIVMSGSIGAVGRTDDWRGAQHNFGLCFFVCSQTKSGKSG